MADGLHRRSGAVARSASATARSPASTRPTSARTCSRRSWSAPASTPARSTTSLWGCVGPDGTAGVEHRPDHRALGRASRRGARHHDRPAVRVVAAGAALRRAGGDVRHAGPRRRRRRRGDEPGADRARRRLIGLEHGMAHPRGGQGWAERYGDQEISQFRGAELIAEKWGLSREAMEQYALESHARALRATADAGSSTRRSRRWAGSRTTRAARRDHRREAGRRSHAAAARAGRLTAALASQVVRRRRGAAGRLRRAVRRHGLTPLARVHTMAVVGSDPVLMLTGPIPATEALLEPLRRRARRHRGVRGQRGVRQRPDGLADGDRRRPGPNQPAGRRDRPRATRSAATGARLDDDAAAPDAARRAPLRPADHVRGRRDGQRDACCRAGVTGAESRRRRHRPAPVPRGLIACLCLRGADRRGRRRTGQPDRPRGLPRAGRLDRGRPVDADHHAARRRRRHSGRVPARRRAAAPRPSSSARCSSSARVARRRALVPTFPGLLAGPGAAGPRLRHGAADRAPSRASS